MSGVVSVLRRAGELLVEPAPMTRLPSAAPLEVVVTALAAGAGATAVSRGLAIALRRLRPVELTGIGTSGAVAAGPGTAVVRDTAPADASLLCHRGPGRVLVAVADARREPALAALVLEVLAKRNERVVLVGNRVRDVDAWRRHGAICVPESRLGAWLVDRGRRPPGAMGAAFDALARRSGSIAEHGPDNATR
ncbi:MAG: hypothetical protein ACRDLQ_07235 [Solirubrobacterales bacterium]